MPDSPAQEPTPPGQSTAAAERSAHVTRGPERAPPAWPVVEVAPGIYALRCVAELRAEVNALRAELGLAVVG